MADIFSGAGSDAIFSAAISAQSQRTSFANYAIQKAAGYMQDNRNDEAIKEFKKALAFDPQNLTALTYIGNLNLAKGDTGEAIKAFKNMVAQQPTSVTAHVNLGNAYLQAKQYKDSEKEFKSAARMDPLNPLADYTLGIQYLQTNRLSEAEAQFLKVQKVSPKDGNVYYSLGATYNKQGKYEDAAKNLQKALTLKKDFPSANYELGVAYANLGKTDKAQEQYKILTSSDPGQASDLKFVMEKPKIVSMNTSNSGGFVELLGPGTPLWALDPSLLSPNASKQFSIKFQFTNQMDLASVINPSNWSISRGKGTQAGYYNNSMPTTSKEVNIPKIPLSVSYNAVTNEATVNFRINQNANGDATIDPKHLVFAFKGKDAAGRTMDSSADQIDGYALQAF